MDVVEHAGIEPARQRSCKDRPRTQRVPRDWWAVSDLARLL